jgi:hypothetical protein
MPESDRNLRPVLRPIHGSDALLQRALRQPFRGVLLHGSEHFVAMNPPHRAVGEHFVFPPATDPDFLLLTSQEQCALLIPTTSQSRTSSGCCRLSLTPNYMLSLGRGGTHIKGDGASEENMIESPTAGAHQSTAGFATGFLRRLRGFSIQRFSRLSLRTPRVMVGPAQLISTMQPSFWRRRKSGAREPASARRTLSAAKSDSMRARSAAIVCLPSAAKWRLKYARSSASFVADNSLWRNSSSESTASRYVTGRPDWERSAST